MASCSKVKCTYQGVGVVVYQEAMQQKHVVFWTWEAGKERLEFWEENKEVKNEEKCFPASCPSAHE